VAARRAGYPVVLWCRSLMSRARSRFCRASWSRPLRCCSSARLRRSVAASAVSAPCRSLMVSALESASMAWASGLRPPECWPPGAGTRLAGCPGVRTFPPPSPPSAGIERSRLPCHQPPRHPRRAGPVQPAVADQVHRATPYAARTRAWSAEGCTGRSCSRPERRRARPFQLHGGGSRYSRRSRTRSEPADATST
jgi:hypothetical protein